MTIPRSLIREAETKTNDYQIARRLAAAGSPPRDWNDAHPCTFGVFQNSDGYAVAPLFPHVITNMRRDGFRCVYRAG